MTILVIGKRPPSYPYGLLRRDVIIAALGGPLPSEGKGHTFELCRVRHSSNTA